MNENCYSMQTIYYKNFMVGLLNWKPRHGQHTNGTYPTTGIVFDSENNILFSTRSDLRSEIKVLNLCRNFIDNKENEI